MHFSETFFSFACFINWQTYLKKYGKSIYFEIMNNSCVVLAISLAISISSFSFINSHFISNFWFPSFSNSFILFIFIFSIFSKFSFGVFSILVFLVLFLVFLVLLAFLFRLGLIVLYVLKKMVYNDLQWFYNDLHISWFWISARIVYYTLLPGIKGLVIYISWGN